MNHTLYKVLLATLPSLFLGQVGLGNGARTLLYIYSHTNPASSKNSSCCGSAMVTNELAYFSQLLFTVLLVVLPHLELLGSLE